MSYQIDALLNNAPCGFLSFIDDGTIVIVNATLLALLEYELNELCGRNIQLILPIASRIFYQTHFFPLLKVQAKVEEIYFSLRSKQGTDIPILINAVRRENIGSFVNDCILIPIRHRIQYEDEILKAKKATEAAIRAQQEAEIALRLQYERTLLELRERQRAELIIRQLAEREILLRKITQQIHQSLNLSEIFEIACAGICQCLHAERVGIFKFHPNSNFLMGEFISETVGLEWDSAMGTIIYEHCFSEQYIADYQKGNIQVVADIYQSELSDCYRNILEKFQIRSHLVVPLWKVEDLWGLLCVHQCSAPRSWEEFEIDFVKQIANQLAIAIQQADLFEKLQKELTERKQVEARLIETNKELAGATFLLEQMVNTDALTQIANRRCFNYRLEQEWQGLYRKHQPLSLLLLDVDYFKRYNDYYGHQLGDNCLIRVAQAIQQVVYRPGDLVARYGGEEFVVILPNTDAEGAIAVAQRIHGAVQALAIPHQASEVSNTITISIGISTIVPSSELSEAILINQADQALYRAKQMGRNQSITFN